MEIEDLKNKPLPILFIRVEMGCNFLKKLMVRYGFLTISSFTR